MKRYRLARLALACVLVPTTWGCVSKPADPPAPAPAPREVKAEPAAPPPRPKAPPAPFPVDMTRSTFKVQTHGSFSTRPSWDVNLINAPVTAHQNRPPPLKVDAAVLNRLNNQQWLVTSKILKRRKMTIIAGEPVITALTGPTGDRHFALNIAFGPNNGTGGHASGMTFDVVLTSRHRDARKYRAVSRQTIEARQAGPAVAELERKLDQALGEVFTRFQEALAAGAEARRRPQPFFILAVKLGNLDKKQQDHARDSVLPCLFKQGWTTTVTGRKSPQGMLRYAVHYEVKDNRSASKITEGIALSFAAVASNHGKSRCSLWRSPLEGYETRAEARPAGKQITLRWVDTKKKKR